MEKRVRRRQTKHQPRGSRLPNLILLTLFTLLSAYLIFLMLAYNFLAFRSINIMVMGALLVVFLLTLGLTMAGRGKWLSRGLLLLASLAVGAGIYAARSAIDLTETFNESARFSQVELSVVVAQESPLTTIEQVGHLVVSSNDPENTDKVLADLQTNKQLAPQTEVTPSYQMAYEAILADGNKAMVLNTAYVTLLEQVDPEFSSKVRTIYTLTVQKEVATPAPVQNSDVLNIYISGIDSYGPISGVSRSDVNIIMTVNRQTNKILLTTTPRDAYVAIAGGGNNQYDKLTHAGIYGIESSIGTLENLYGIDINYYARLNFTSFIELIDTVGGIEVENDQAFTTGDGQEFPAGTIHLDSQRALTFVRERYSLQNGDADRGKNQMKVVTGLLKKLTAVNSLGTYTTLIDQLSSSIQTDMPLSTMMDLANNQLEQNKQYQINSQALTGYGSTGELPSYAMPGAALYMVSVDEASLAAVKQAILDVMEGR